MYISDKHIEMLLSDEYLQEILCYISESCNNKEFIINFILFIFYSQAIEGNSDNERDWINQIIFVFEKNTFNNTMLAPKLKSLNIKIILEDIANSMYKLREFGEIKTNEYCVTYEMFNECLDTLFVWFKDNFEISN